MTDPQPQQRTSHKTEAWDAEDHRWNTDCEGSEEICRNAYDRFREKHPSIPVRLVLVGETTVEMFDPPAPWSERA